MEAPLIQPEARQPEVLEQPRLRLLEGQRAAAEASLASLSAWVVLFGSLAFSGGHGVFLFTALTRLRALPSQAELGGGLEAAAIAWFVAAVPLAFASAALRRHFLRLSSGMAWSLASGALALTLACFAFLLHAVALA